MMNPHDGALDREPKIPGTPAPVRGPVPRGVLSIPAQGLEPADGARKKVVVLGAGIAGLSAGYELVRQGHEVVILEAQDRIGGRIYTLRTFAPGLYAEAGAMRIPRVHALTLAYCGHFKLPLRPFLMGNPKGLVHVAGCRITAEQAEREPEKLCFELEPHERGRTCDELWEAATAEARAILERKGEAGWDEIAAKYDKHSLYDFLQEKGFSEGAIEMYGVLNFVEAELHTAAIEHLREDLGRAYEDMQEIAGGMDQLPRAFYPSLEPYVRFGCEIFALDQDGDSVTVHYKTESGRWHVTADYAICTLPFSVLRYVETLKPFSREKQRAIRQLSYSASTKILFQVRERIWETVDGIYGGGTVTDLPIRRMNYPTPDPATKRGVLLASYTWGQDALRWGSLDNESRFEQALDDVSQIHPGIRDVYEVGATHAWYGDKYAGGAFALFSPGQQTELHDDIVRPEGRIHFAGEHCSLWHAWIQGSLESALVAARTIHTSP